MSQMILKNVISQLRNFSQTGDTTHFIYLVESIYEIDL